MGDGTNGWDAPYTSSREPRVRSMGDGTKYAAWIYPLYSSVIAHLDVGSQRGNQTEARAIVQTCSFGRIVIVINIHKFCLSSFAIGNAVFLCSPLLCARAGSRGT